MALITKADLEGTYSWTAISGDDPRISGPPDSTLFNRQEGYEVLYLINKFVEVHNIKNKDLGIKVERIIRNHLPGDVRSQEHVMQWLAFNWNRYL